MHFNEIPFNTSKFLNCVNHRDCPLCGAKDFEHDNFNTFVENRHLYVVKICDKCGFVFQNPIYNKEHYHSLPCHYPEDYFKHSVNRGSYTYRFFKEFIKRDPKVDVLDIGAGRCEPLKYILNAGFSGHHAYKDANSYRGTAITMDPKETIYMADKWNMDIYHFDFEDNERVDEFIENNRKKFDFIIMSHVLEHFIDPDKAIKNVIKLLAPDGIVYIEVPSLYNAEYRIKSVWTPEHVSYFTNSTLTRLMMNNRFWCEKFVDSKIWGNIKAVYSYVGLEADIDYWDTTKIDNIKGKYKSNYYRKWFQRIKHKLGFKYDSNT